MSRRALLASSVRPLDVAPLDAAADFARGYGQAGNIFSRAARRPLAESLEVLRQVVAEPVPVAAEMSETRYRRLLREVDAQRAANDPQPARIAGAPVTFLGLKVYVAADIPPGYDWAFIRYSDGSRRPA